MIDPITGKQSAQQSAFSEATWGKPTQSYLKSATNINDVTMEVIMDEAKEFARVTNLKVSCDKDEENDDANPYDHCAHLPLGEGSDSSLTGSDESS